MLENYKLTEEIKEFIIQQKTTYPNLSCRGMIPLIKARFQVVLSKSLVNKVIKERNLSKPVGRRNIVKEKVIFKLPVETQIIRKEVDYMENGGCFFLRAADIKLYLSSHLAQNLLAYFPYLSHQNLQGVTEAMIYNPIFKNKKSLWTLIGKEIPAESLERCAQQLAQISLTALNNQLANKLFSHNINKINELYKECLLRLNTYVQLNFFPPVYKVMDFASMLDRFYGLSAKIEKKPSLLRIQLVYPENFIWAKDVVWGEDFSYAAQKVNKAGIFTAEGEQIWINPTLVSR